MTKEQEWKLAAEAEVAEALQRMKARDYLGARRRLVFALECLVRADWEAHWEADEQAQVPTQAGAVSAGD